MQRKRLTGEQRAQLLQEQKRLREQFVERVALEREEKKRAEAETRKLRASMQCKRASYDESRVRIDSSTMRVPELLLECIREIAKSENTTSSQVVRDVLVAMINVDVAELMRYMKISQDLRLNEVDVKNTVSPTRTQRNHNATQGETR